MRDGGFDVCVQTCSVAPVQPGNMRPRALCSVLALFLSVLLVCFLFDVLVFLLGLLLCTCAVLAGSQVPYPHVDAPRSMPPRVPHPRGSRCSAPWVKEQHPPHG